MDAIGKFWKPVEVDTGTTHLEVFASFIPFKDRFDFPLSDSGWPGSLWLHDDGQVLADLYRELGPNRFDRETAFNHVEKILPIGYTLENGVIHFATEVVDLGTTEDAYNRFVTQLGTLFNDVLKRF